MHNKSISESHLYFTDVKHSQHYTRKHNNEGPRQYTPFVDASKSAYGAVSYLRTEHPNGRVEVNIVASKTRVTPLMPVSIPRLELLAAVLGLRLALVIARALNLHISTVLV